MPVTPQAKPKVSQIPDVPWDYASVWAQQITAHGGNLKHEAIRRDLYLQAIEELRNGRLGVKGNYQEAAAMVDEWVQTQFLTKIPTGYPDLSVCHQALAGHLYREGVHRLREYDLGIDGAAEIADAVDRYVKQRFYKQLTQGE